ncbi:MAG: 3-isopropylmalate dehydratase large subunit [Elusimicrobia bacterium]|nr:3-isopropylmalate dehydratase large subunit [Elusimicrobiota bacterium]
MGQTIIEKIFSRHVGKKVSANEIVLAKIDFCLGQDGTSGIVIDSFKKMGAEKVFNPRQMAVIIDHSSPSPNEGVSRIHKKIRDFSLEQKINFYDIGQGVCHQIVPERGYVVPGDLVIGADSHTCTYGALNIAATGMGSTDVAACAATGQNWFKVPATIKFICQGKLPLGVYSKDLILYLIGQIGADGATYLSCEYTGQAIDALSIESRFTIANMAIEMGAKFGIMNGDQKTLAWVKKHSSRKFKFVQADQDAVYSKALEFNISQLTPQIAKPHQVDNVCPLSEVAGTPIAQGYIGTCTNGRLEDFAEAGKILRGRKIKKGVRLIIAPASNWILKEAMKKGYINILLEAGATLVTPGCGPCVGTHNGVPADGENVISTANRNFKGRMGNINAFIYLGSPATVAAAVIEGKIADPRKYLK